MPPTKRRNSKSADKAMATVMALLAKHGVDTGEVEKPEVPRYDYRSADAVVVFAHAPKHFVPGVCKECNRHFAHNRPIAVGSVIGFCSDTCRRDNWKKTTGIPLTALSTSNIWNGDVPMVITADQYEALEKMADWFIEHRANLQLTEPPPVELVVEAQEPKPAQDQDDVLANLLDEPVLSDSSRIEDNTSLDDFFDSL